MFTDKIRLERVVSYRDVSGREYMISLRISYSLAFANLVYFACVHVFSYGLCCYVVLVYLGTILPGNVSSFSSSISIMFMFVFPNIIFHMYW